MEDNVSIKSSDSVTTSGEYEIVSELLDCPATAEAAGTGAAAASSSKPSATAASDATGKAKAPAKSPTLRIANNGDLIELEKNMHEVIHDEQDGTAASVQASPSTGAAVAESIVRGGTAETGSASAIGTGMYRDRESHLFTHTCGRSTRVSYERTYIMRSRTCREYRHRNHRLAWARFFVSCNVWVHRVFGYDGESLSSVGLRVSRRHSSSVCLYKI